MAGGKPNPWALGVLGVAVAALVTDRFIIPAGADEQGTPSEAFDVTETAESQAPVPASPVPTLAERFAPYAESDEALDDIGDAFRPIGANARDTAEQDTKADDDRAALRLSAVLSRDDGDIAVINGRPLRVGQSFDGIRVLAIEADSVRVDTGVGPITLRIDRPTLGGR